MNHLVSIIVPAFNAGETIREALMSALAQTYQSIEIIVCDDASGDGTVEVIKELADPRITIVSHQFNLGPGTARDTAISIARGEWLAFLDADDAWHPSRLEKLMDFANAGEVIFDDLHLCYDGGDRLIPFRRVHGSRGFGVRGNHGFVKLADYIMSERLLIQPVIHTASLRNSGLCHSDRRFAEDAEFYISLCLAGLRMHYVAIPLYYYRLTRGSLSTNPLERGQMRNMLVEFLADGRLPSDVTIAIMHKTKRLTMDERAYEAISMLSRGELRGFLRHIWSNPLILTRIARRAPQRVLYELHRTLLKVLGRQIESR